MRSPRDHGLPHHRKREGPQDHRHDGHVHPLLSQASHHIHARRLRLRRQRTHRGPVLHRRSRLRPVLMTTLTTILGMVPMAIGGGEGSEMWRPFGVSGIGGLTVSTVLTLILVPVLYCSFAGTGIKRARKKMKSNRELNDYYQSHKEEMTKGKNI